MKLILNSIFLLISFNVFSQNYQVHESLFFLTTKDCYDCRDCKSSRSTNTVKGDFKVEEKYMRLFCDGENAGVVTLYRVTECLEERYTVDFVKGVFRSESEAKSYLNNFAENLCANNEIIVDGKIVNKIEYTKKIAEEERMKREKEDRERKERAQLIADLKSGKINADTVEWTNSIRESTISKEIILSSQWKIFNKRDYTPQRLAFLEDGTYQLFDSKAPSGEKDETGPYFFNEDNTVTLFRAPVINLYSKKITVFKETYSFWEKEGALYISSSKNQNVELEASAFLKDLKLQNEDVVGDWHLEVWSSKYDEPLDLVFRIKEEGDSLICNLIHFQIQEKLYCDDAYGVIEIKNGSFLKMMVYFDNDCCTGTQSELKCYAFNKNLLYGEFYNNYGKPTSCAQALWRADVKAVKLLTYKGELFQKGKTKNKIKYSKSNQKRKPQSNTKHKNTNQSTSQNIEAENNQIFSSLDYKNFEMWESENSKIEIKSGIVSLVPKKKKNPASFTSPIFKLGARDNYLRISLDQSRIKSGRIKILVKDAETEELEEVYSEKISLSLDEINRQIRDFDILDELEKKENQFKTEKINIRKFRNKSIKLIIAYKATGLSKPPLFIGKIE